MTLSGESPGAGGVSEPDWIDQILERASKQVDDRAAERTNGRPSVLPDTSPRPTPAPSTASSADSLAEIRWVDEVNVTPASTPVVATEKVLTPQAVGRSAYDGELASLGDADPAGWDQLSWTDLDDAETPPAARKMQEPSSFGQIVREWGPVLFAAVAIALFTRLVLVQAYHIPSESMTNTLQDGDRVVVNRLSYTFGEIERGQVVVFAKPAGTAGENDLIKRVIGLPGETVRLVDRQVYIDGFRVDEPYLREPNNTRTRLRIPGCAQSEAAADLCVVPEGHVFVMGDNRNGSSDSRVFGPVSTDDIVGRAFMRVWPPNNLGQL